MIKFVQIDVDGNEVPGASFEGDILGSVVKDERVYLFILHTDGRVKQVELLQELSAVPRGKIELV